MKRVRLLVFAAAALALLVSVYGQSRKSVEVTPQTIANQPVGKPYVIDLTRNGKTYTVTASVANRVRLRASNGETAMPDLMKKLGLTDGRFLNGSSFLVGTLSDLRAVNFGRRPATRTALTARAKNLTCGPFLCVCDPDIEGDCFGRKLVCAGPMVCWVCDGPDCSPEQTHRWTCACIHI